MADDDEPRPIGEVMDGLLRSLRGGSGPSSRAVGGVFARWDDIVGATIASHVRPVRLDDGVLIVEVTDPAWATQVRLLSDRLRSRLSEVVDVQVHTVDVRVTAPGSRRR
jgi:predicted nucleic acid-binding Zn ribbon protein